MASPSNCTPFDSTVRELRLAEVGVVGESRLREEARGQTRGEFLVRAECIKHLLEELRADYYPPRIQGAAPTQPHDFLRKLAITEVSEATRTTLNTRAIAA
jgi:hypothetical protein